MEIVRLQYKCQLCGAVFVIKSDLSPEQAEEMLNSILYGTDPSVATLQFVINWHEKHECLSWCGALDREFHLISPKSIGVGKLIGYNIETVPDPGEKPNLRKVKG